MVEDFHEDFPLSRKVNLQMQRIVKHCSNNHMEFLCNQYKETVKLHVFIHVLQFSNKIANKDVNKNAHKRFCSPLSGLASSILTRGPACDCPLPPNRVLNNNSQCCMAGCCSSNLCTCKIFPHRNL